MGPKAGLNGVDNGFLIFDNYRLGPESLLRKSKKQGGSKSTSTSLSTLSMGRVGIVNLSTRLLQMGVVIAVRYAGVRKQFGPTPSGMSSRIMYPSTHRLF